MQGFFQMASQIKARGNQLAAAVIVISRGYGLGGGKAGAQQGITGFNRMDLTTFPRRLRLAEPFQGFQAKKTSTGFSQ